MQFIHYQNGLRREHAAASLLVKTTGHVHTLLSTQTAQQSMVFLQCASKSTAAQTKQVYHHQQQQLSIISMVRHHYYLPRGRWPMDTAAGSPTFCLLRRLQSWANDNKPCLVSTLDPHTRSNHRHPDIPIRSQPWQRASGIEAHSLRHTSISPSLAAATLCAHSLSFDPSIPKAKKHR